MLFARALRVSMGGMTWCYETHPKLSHVGCWYVYRDILRLQRELTPSQVPRIPSQRVTSGMNACFRFCSHTLTVKKISTKCWNKGRDPIARAGLAHQIARKIKQYLDSMAVSLRCDEIVRLVLLTINPQQRPYSVGESTPRQWKIGEGFMDLDNMFLARFESVSTGSWQPVVWVVDPTM